MPKQFIKTIAVICFKHDQTIGSAIDCKFIAKLSGNEQKEINVELNGAYWKGLNAQLH